MQHLIFKNVAISEIQTRNVFSLLHVLTVLEYLKQYILSTKPRLYDIQSSTTQIYISPIIMYDKHYTILQ